MDITKSIEDYIKSLCQRPISESSSVFEYRIDDTKLPAHFPVSMQVMKIRGDGLCWINSIVGTIFGRFWKQPQLLNKWFNDLLTTFVAYDPEFPLFFALNTMKINFKGADLIAFLNLNKNLLFALSHNIIGFCTMHYTNPVININCPRIVPLEVSVGRSANGSFTAVDCNMRSFVMNVCGISQIKVFQNRTDVQFRRKADPFNSVSILTHNDSYAGFQLESFGTINVGGYVGSIILYSYNASHYDAFVQNDLMRYPVLALYVPRQPEPHFVQVVADPVAMSAFSSAVSTTRLPILKPVKAIGQSSEKSELKLNSMKKAKSIALVPVSKKTKVSGLAKSEATVSVQQSALASATDSDYALALSLSLADESLTLKKNPILTMSDYTDGSIPDELLFELLKDV